MKLRAGFALVALVSGIASADTVSVDVRNNFFRTVSNVPGMGTDTTTIQVGDTVHWTWFGNFHSVTAEDGSFDSGVHNMPFSFQHTFNTPGTFPYFCSVHGGHHGAGMSGVIEVVGGGTDCPGDVDGDSDVDLTDLATLLSNFGLSHDEPIAGDLDGDMDVDLTDLAMLLAEFGSVCV